MAKKKRIIFIIVLTVIIVLGGLRLYSHFAPWGLGLRVFSFWFLSADYGYIDSPQGTHRVFCFVCRPGTPYSYLWLVEDHWLWGKVVVTEGYLETSGSSSGIPIKWNDEDSFTISFNEGPPSLKPYGHYVDLE